MDSGTALVIMVGIIAAAMVIISISAMTFVTSFRQSMDRLESTVNRVASDLQPVLQSAREALTEGREKMAVISANVIEITDTVRGQVARIDGVVVEATERARVQLARLDHLLTDTVNRVEETGEVVRQSIVKPIREASAILSGVRASLDFLFRRNRGGADRVTPDEELFI